MPPQTRGLAPGMACRTPAEAADLVSLPADRLPASGRYPCSQRTDIRATRAASVPTLAVQDVVTLGDGEAIIGLERDGRVEAGQRFIPPVEVHQGKPPVVVGRGDIRLQANRRTDLPFRGFEFLLLQENQAQQIGRFE